MPPACRRHQQKTSKASQPPLTKALGFRGPPDSDFERASSLRQKQHGDSPWNPERKGKERREGNARASVLNSLASTPPSSCGRNLAAALLLRESNSVQRDRGPATSFSPSPSLSPCGLFPQFSPNPCSSPRCSAEELSQGHAICAEIVQLLRPPSRRSRSYFRTTRHSQI